MLASGGIVFTIGLVAFALHLAWQISAVRYRRSRFSACALFKGNRDSGLILFATMILDVVVRRVVG